RLYTNGIPVASLSLPNGTYTPATIGGAGGTSENMLGNDVYGDEQFSGTVYEFRIWNGIVSPLYLAISAAAGPGAVATNLTPSSLTVTVTNLSMGAGFAQQAAASGNFSATAGVPVTGFITNWSSSDPEVVNVSNNGLLTALNPGSVTISAVLDGVTGTSSFITVTSTPPVITRQPPAAESLLSGATLQVSIANAGSPPFTYRWYMNSSPAPLTTSTSPALTLSPLQAADAGSYTCVVSNQSGVATSSPLNLSILSPNPYQQSLLSLNPIAYWPLDETDGTVARDLVGADDGTYVGGCALGQAGPTNSFFGSSANAVLFDGTSGYVDIPEGPFNLTGPLTAMLWVNVVSSPNFAGLFGHGDLSWRITLNNSGEPGASDGNATDVTSSASIVDGQWHMIAYTYSGVPGVNNGLLYVDGTLAGSQNVTAAPSGDNLDVWIGGSPDYATARLANAKIADVALFDQALTATQLQDLSAGVYAGPVVLNLARAGTNITLNWPAGVLLQAPTLFGPWTTDNVAAPYTLPITDSNQFFKVLVSP
ncbi:MAG TPA: LamG-like jellyroll fold domain-containing protein, partial [Verrucomicrobiae bacterium]|nr:LamG-like jellyroll fold domain-containing protein [Verrucomicrobiae bacterium]